MGIRVNHEISQSREWEWEQRRHGNGMGGIGYTKVIPAHFYLTPTGSLVAQGMV